MTNQIVLTQPLSLNLIRPDDLLTRLEIGSGIIYDLHKSGHRCTNIYKKFSCDICECKDKPLCKAIKLFIKLEREYYLLRIVELIGEIVKQKEKLPEQKKPMNQMRLF